MTMDDFQKRFDDLKEMIGKERAYGKMTMKYVSGQGSDATQLHNFLEKLDYVQYGLPPVTISRSLGEDILTGVMGKDLMGSSRIMNDDRARELVREFISLFNQGESVFLSNTNEAPYTTPGQWGWNGITSAGMDTGLIIYDDIHIGILWFEEND